MTAPSRITVRLASGQDLAAILHSYVNLQLETGLNKTAIFLGKMGQPDFVASKSMGEWSEIPEIAGRPAIDVAREVSAPYKSPDDVVARFRAYVDFEATERLISHLEKQRKNRQFHVFLYCLPDGTYDIMRENSDHSIMEPYAVAKCSCGIWTAGPTMGIHRNVAKEVLDDQQSDYVPPAPGMR